MDVMSTPQMEKARTGKLPFEGDAGGSSSPGGSGGPIEKGKGVIFFFFGKERRGFDGKYKKGELKLEAGEISGVR